MFKNVAIWLVLVVPLCLGIAWIVHYLWKTQVQGVDFSVSTIALSDLGIYLILNTDRIWWFLAFVLVSAAQVIVARNLFSA